MFCIKPLKGNHLEIPEIEDSMQRFIEVIGIVVDKNIISFLTYINMGSNVSMSLYTTSYECN